MEAETQGPVTPSPEPHPDPIVEQDPGPEPAPDPEPPPQPDADVAIEEIVHGLADRIVAVEDRHKKLVGQLLSQGLLPASYEDE